MTKSLRIILLGFGVVGKALSEILLARSGELQRRYGLKIDVVAVADAQSSIANEKGLDLTKVLIRKGRTGAVGERTNSSGASRLIGEVDADVVVEMTPANPVDAEPGLTHIRAAFASGKSVVTANKMPLAVDYPNLIRLAKAKNLRLKYSACVGAGVPVLEFGEACAESEPVVRIDGILNATSNFVLSKMEEDGIDFQKALDEAKRLGYAEANPSLDIDGTDAACKIVILADHLLNMSSTIKDVKLVEGIRLVSLSRVKVAMSKGRRIRMLASAGKQLEVRVAELPGEDPLAVSGPFNAVRFECKYSGPRVVSGPAAGGSTTSSALLRDLIQIGRASLA